MNKEHETQLLTTGAMLSNRYLIQETIGVGGMGAVYKARDLHFPNVTKLVAVKEMVNRAHDPLIRETIVKNFEREANLLATLSHPAIPRIFDYFSQQERSYLILEFIQGKDLENILNESSGFLPVDQVLQWAIELCDVLDYLHNHQPGPIIFRDMKPSNAMINQHNHVVLVDFGIAKTFQIGEKGTMIGTEGYSPPEQYRGEASALADIYSLGATLHHLLTRRDPRLEPPFSFSERPITAINPNVTKELEMVIQRALQYEPGDRFQSAREMKEALLEIAYKQGLPSDSSGLILQVDVSDKITPRWTFACKDEIRGSANYEKGIVYFGSYDQNLYALNASSGKLLWKYKADGGIVTKPAIAGDSVCFGSEDYRLHVLSARTGTIQWTYYTKGPVHSSPVIAHGHVFIGSDDGSIHAINMTSGRGVWQMNTGAPIRSTPLLTNDSIYIGNEAGDVFCLDFRGNPRWRFKARRAVTSTPILADNLILIGSLDAFLYAIDAKSGWLIWRFRLAKGTISSVAVYEGLVFTGCIDGNIYCIDLHNAREVWRFQTAHQVTGSPIIYNGFLYCGSVDGFLYCLEPRTGLLHWKFKTNGPITGTPVAADHTIFVGSTDHHFYALPADISA
jgi:outer membrane protein assembly factor BamB/tRNA A-37 threonylcarbamoyl transferase component Bud32